MTFEAQHSPIVVLLAGVAFLLFGLNLASESLQNLAANQIRKILNRLDENGITGVIVGTLLTLIMQSSGALTATLVNLGSARVLTLSQVMGVLIGSAIGAALTVQLISLHVIELGLPLIIAGFLCTLFAKRRKVRVACEFAMGLGFIFFGLEMVSRGAGSMVAGPRFFEVFAAIRANWLAELAISAGITSLFHSATATIGIVLGLVTSGVVTVEDSIIWIYGANIGTTTTALVASISANYLGRRIAWANFFYRSASVVIFMPLASACLWLTDGLAPSHQVATIYLLLTLFAAAVFFPIRRYGVRFVERVFGPDAAEQEFGVRFLKRSNYDSFSMGLAHAKRELLDMGDIVSQMLELSLQVFRDEDPDLIYRIQRLDDRVDLLLKEIKLFLIRVSDLAPEGLNQSVIDVISFGSDLEAAADMIDHHLLDLAKKKSTQHLEFSQDGWTALQETHQNACRAVSMAITYFQTEDFSLRDQLLSLKALTRDQEKPEPKLPTSAIL